MYGQPAPTIRGHHRSDSTHQPHRDAHQRFRHTHLDRDRRSWATQEELRIAIVRWIERTYHRRRRQAALGRLTPVEYEMIMSPTAAQAAQPKLSPVRAADPGDRTGYPITHAWIGWVHGLVGVTT